MKKNKKDYYMPEDVPQYGQPQYREDYNRPPRYESYEVYDDDYDDDDDYGPHIYNQRPPGGIYKVLSPIGYLLYDLLFMVPIVGWVLAIVFAVKRNKMIRRSFAIFEIIKFCIIFVAIVGAFVLIKLYPAKMSELVSDNVREKAPWFFDWWLGPKATPVEPTVDPSAFIH